MKLSLTISSHKEMIICQAKFRMTFENEILAL